MSDLDRVTFAVITVAGDIFAMMLALWMWLSPTVAIMIGIGLTARRQVSSSAGGDSGLA